MKFWDSFKMAIHNLWHNKSRSILTIAIVFVVSLLIMAMVLMGSNFITNQETVNMQVFEKFGTAYRLENKNNYYPQDGGHESNAERELRQTDSSEALRVMQKSVGYTDIIDTFYYTCDFFQGVFMDGKSLTYNINRDDFAFAAYDFAFNTKIGALQEGRIWNAADINTNNVWIQQSLVASASAMGKKLGIGDTITVGLAKRNSTGSAQNTLNVDCVVAGIFEAVEDDNIYGYRPPTPSILSCARYMNTKFNEVSSQINMVISYTPVVGSYDFSVSESRMKAFVNDVNSEIGMGIDWNNKQAARFSCQILEEMKMTMVMGLIIMGAVMVLAFIVLLLSIGSIANTIIISVDKNRRFIGLMKAMGLNNKGVKGMVYKEAFVCIILGIALATLVIFCAKGLILQLLIKMFGGMFSSYGIEPVVTFTFNFFIPIGTLLAFIGMAVLFSKGALNKMGKADPIAIISEVA